MATTGATKLDVSYTGVKIAASVLLAVSWIAFLLRVYVKVRIMGSFGRDDWFMLVTQVLSTAVCVLAILLSTITLDPTFETFNVLLGYTLSLFCSYIVSAVTLKISVAFFYTRIVLDRWHRALIYALLLLNILFGIVYIGISVFECGDPRHYCERLFAGKCLSGESVVGPIIYTQAVLSAITDWIFVAIPIYFVQSTQLRRRAKASVIAVIILAASGSVASVVRIGYMDVLGAQNSKAFPRARTFLLVTIIENGLCITAGSLATLRPLLTLCIDKYNSAPGSSDPEAHRLDPRSAGSLQKDVKLEFQESQTGPSGRDSKGPFGSQNGLALNSNRLDREASAIPSSCITTIK